MELYNFIQKKGLAISVAVAVLLIVVGWIAYDPADPVGSVGTLLFMGMLFGVLALLGVLGFHAFHGALNPKRLITFGIGLGVILLIFGVSYLIADSEIPQNLIDTGVEVTPGEMRISGALIGSTVVLAVLVVVGIVASEVKKLIK